MSQPMAEPETPVVFLHQVERRYHQGDAVLEILKGGDLAIWPGQSVALVAPSGAGKSTLLHITGLLEHADGGEVYLDGAPTSGLTDAVRTRMRRNSIGFVYQADNLLPFLTLIENVGLQLALNGQTSGAGRSLAVLAELGLAGLAYRLPDHLSGGQRQRASVARAIVHQPEIILADEPTGALDTGNAVGVIDLLLGMQREIGATLIMVTHDRDAASRLDRQIHLRDGRVS